MSYRELDAGLIIATQERLARRIEERFPGSSLAGVSRDLLGLARDSVGEAFSLGAPNWPVRTASLAAGAAMLALVIWASAQVGRVASRAGAAGVSDLLQAADAVLNELVLLGAAVYFLTTLEARLKRRIALRRLHQLRSLAHIVDMHQLTKDPHRIRHAQEDTTSSPVRSMTVAELGRYLDYCSELLSMCGKCAALFVQRFNDSLVLQSVNEIEDLTNGLSRKVWQKISLLERVPS